MPSLSTILTVVSIWLALSIVTGLGIGAVIKRDRQRARHRATAAR